MSVSATQNDRVFIIVESFRRFWLLFPSVLFPQVVLFREDSDSQ